MHDKKKSMKRIESKSQYNLFNKFYRLLTNLAKDTNTNQLWVKREKKSHLKVLHWHKPNSNKGYKHKKMAYKVDPQC